MHTLGNVRYNKKQNDPIMAWKSMKLFRTALPVNFVGHHICVEKGSFLHNFFSWITRFIGEDGIVRTRFHEGKLRMQRITMKKVSEPPDSYYDNVAFLLQEHPKKLTEISPASVSIMFTLPCPNRAIRKWTNTRSF